MAGAHETHAHEFKAKYARTAFLELFSILFPFAWQAFKGDVILVQ